VIAVPILPCRCDKPAGGEAAPEGLAPPLWDAAGRLRSRASLSANWSNGAAGRPVIACGQPGTTCGGGRSPDCNRCGLRPGTGIWLHVDAGDRWCLALSERHAERVRESAWPIRFSFDPSKAAGSQPKTRRCCCSTESRPACRPLRHGSLVVEPSGALPWRANHGLQGAARQRSQALAWAAPAGVLKASDRLIRSGDRAGAGGLRKRAGNRPFPRGPSAC